MLDKQVGAYTVAEEIGRGSFAVVSKGYHMVLPPRNCLVLFLLILCIL